MASPLAAGCYKSFLVIDISYIHLWQLVTTNYGLPLATRDHLAIGHYKSYEALDSRLQYIDNDLKDNMFLIISLVHSNKRI